MQDQTIQWLSVMLGSLLFLDACKWVVTRHVVAGRVGGDTPRSCCRNDNREDARRGCPGDGATLFGINISAGKSLTTLQVAAMWGLEVKDSVA